MLPQVAETKLLIMSWGSVLCCTILVCVLACNFSMCVCVVTSLTFLHHANAQTLLKAAVLAAVASPLVHRTVLTGQTHILGVFLHGALQKKRNRHTDNQPPNTIGHRFDLFNSISVFFSPLPHQRMKAEARRSDFNYALKGGGDISIIR